MTTAGAAAGGATVAEVGGGFVELGRRGTMPPRSPVWWPGPMLVEVAPEASLMRELGGGPPRVPCAAVLLPADAGRGRSAS